MICREVPNAKEVVSKINKHRKDAETLRADNQYLFSLRPCASTVKINF